MKTVELTKGQVALVDDEDFESLSRWSWYAEWAPCTKSFYARRVAPGTNRKIYMHRQILGAKRGEQVDHKNHSTLDNRRANIWIVDAAQNGKNRSTQVNNTSGATGVRKHKASNKWIAYINHNGSRKHLGSFKHFHDAVSVRRSAEIEFNFELNRP